MIPRLAPWANHCRHSVALVPEKFTTHLQPLGNVARNPSVQNVAAISSAQCRPTRGGLLRRWLGQTIQKANAAARSIRKAASQGEGNRQQFDEETPENAAFSVLSGANQIAETGLEPVTPGL